MAGTENSWIEETQPTDCMWECLHTHHKQSLKQLVFVMQALIKQTTTITALLCNHQNATSLPVSTVVEIEPGFLVKVLLTLASEASSSALNSISLAVASAAQIDDRRIDAAFFRLRRQTGGRLVKLDIVTTSYEDAMSLGSLVDKTIVSALLGIGINVEKWSTTIVSPDGVTMGLPEQVNSGLSRDAIIGLAVGLGVGIPLLFAVLLWFLYQQRIGNNQKHARKQPLSRVVLGDICYKQSEIESAEDRPVPNQESRPEQSGIESTKNMDSDRQQEMESAESRLRQGPHTAAGTHTNQHIHPLARSSLQQSIHPHLRLAIPRVSERGSMAQRVNTSTFIPSFESVARQWIPQVEQNYVLQEVCETPSMTVVQHFGGSEMAASMSPPPSGRSTFSSIEIPLHELMRPRSRPAYPYWAPPGLYPFSLQSYSSGLGANNVQDNLLLTVQDMAWYDQQFFPGALQGPAINHLPWGSYDDAEGWASFHEGEEPLTVISVDPLQSILPVGPGEQAVCHM